MTMNRSILDQRSVKVSEFKARCLRLLQEVADSDRTIIVTKRGKPIARVIPFRRRAAPICGAHRGEIHVRGDIVRSGGPRWEAEG
ncbi:MAG: type II toxin-antitoxin system Phd/YefM family antitoxin [Acidobacteria bacterium]|nr:type II toxin-antitoxin system Phd/YefM family antitoxin [Acidobacteriota bacterium]